MKGFRWLRDEANDVYLSDAWLNVAKVASASRRHCSWFLWMVRFEWGSDVLAPFGAECIDITGKVQGREKARCAAGRAYLRMRKAAKDAEEE